MIGRTRQQELMLHEELDDQTERQQVLRLQIATDPRDWMSLKELSALHAVEITTAPKSLVH
ncbi:MAG: hypothetical protein Q7S48_02575 [bacterium]|nr:hypothetical protein [bacterium]